MSEAQRFEALHHARLLHVVNPLGDVGLITLWSPWAAVERKLRAEAPGLLHPGASRIAVIANLYGDGMFAMFANLLFNPQIGHLIAAGQDLGLGCPGEIRAFLDHGLEDAELLGRPVRRIRGTGRAFPAVDGFDERPLRERLSFHDLGRLSSPGLVGRLERLIAELPRAGTVASERIRVESPPAPPPAAAGRRPSRVTGHDVARRGPLDCWEELVVRTVRFGQDVQLAKGRRLELLNARAVIGEPREDAPEALAAFGFDLGRFHAYQRAVLDPELPDGISYTYGNRLRGHFDLGATRDTLAAAIERLRADRAGRGAYIALWDDRVDLVPAAGPGSAPCLTALWFRLTEERLSLTATYRSHNLLNAWLENVYGLIAIQRHVAEGAGIAPGPIAVISHSLGIDPASPRYELAIAIARRWRADDELDRSTGKRTLRRDPHGYFVVSADRDRGLIVADHRFEGVLIKRYEAARGVTIEQEIAADMAVSLPSHAMWLGRELARAQALLRAPGRPA